LQNQIDYIRSNTKLTANEICGVLFGVQCSVGESEYLFWKIDIPKKLDISWKSKLNKTSKKSDSQKIYQIMQITDIHLDSIYSTGSESDCGEPLCCRKNNQITDIKSFSGKWGSYPCDVPLDTVLNALTEIARNARFADLWYWTGDIVPHDFWLYNRNSSLMYSKIITQYLEKFTKTVVIPAIGNHESVPLNRFDI
jgi:sphingomyelin phosphodiesterase